MSTSSNTIFDRPKPTGHPSLSQLIPIAEKLVRNARVADTSRGCWCPPPILPLSFCLSLSHPRSFQPSRSSRMDSLDPPRPFQPSAEPHILLSHTYALPSSCERRAGKRRVAPYRTARLLPTRVYPRLSVHCSHSLSFALTSYLFCSCYSLVPVPHSALHPN